jgi:riboflavin kinase/FMN adenylyltransferase
MPVPIVARSLEDLRAVSPKNSAVTLGVFDGVHLGHKRIVRELVRAKQRHGIDQCYLVTFDPHPLVVTHSKMMPPLLTTVEERISILSRYALDGILVLKFDELLAGVEYRAFLDRYLLKPFDMKHFVLGYDCHFGKNREGSPERVKRDAAKLGFTVDIVEAVQQGEEIVSSTRIRNTLIEGDFEKANAYLGHPYIISGKVVRGHGKGRGLGFPTANLSISDPFKLWPPRGVYAVRAVFRDHFLDGMMNVGRAPTMKSLPEETREAEVHLFNFEGNLYDAHLIVYCHSFLREERAFETPAALAEQLEKDRKEAMRRLEGANEG